MTTLITEARPARSRSPARTVAHRLLEGFGLAWPARSAGHGLHPAGRRPVDDLEARLQSIEQQLWRGLIVARFLLPAAILLSLELSDNGRSGRFGTTVVWALLAAWTGATTVYAWPRLEWARTLPPVYLLETAALVAFLLAGFGTREWHAVHSTIPLIFCAVFAARRAAIVVAAALAGAVWAPVALASLGLTAGIEPSEGAATPSVIYAVLTLTLLFARALFDEIRQIVAAQQGAADELRGMRRADVRRRAVAEGSRRISESVAETLTGLVDRAREFVTESGVELSERGRMLISTCESIEASLDDLRSRGKPHATPDEAPTSVLAEIDRVVGRFGLRARAVAIESRLQEDHPLDSNDAAAFRRLLHEVLANALKHGGPPFAVRVTSDRLTWVAIENRSRQGFIPRPDGSGLANIRRDAGTLAAELHFRHEGAVATVQLGLPREPIESADERRRLPSPGSFASTLRARRRAFVDILFASRLALAVASAAVVWLNRSNYRAELALYTATAIGLIAWTAVPVLWRRRAAIVVRRRRQILWVDGCVLIAVNLCEGGLLKSQLQAIHDSLTDPA